MSKTFYRDFCCHLNGHVRGRWPPQIQFDHLLAICQLNVLVRYSLDSPRGGPTSAYGTRRQCGIVSATQVSSFGLQIPQLTSTGSNSY